MTGRVVLALAGLAGCSFTFMQPSTEERPPECYEQYEAPATDAALAVIAGVVTAVMYTHQAGNYEAYAWAATLVYAGSSIYGFNKRGRCEEARKQWRAWCASVGSGERPTSCDDGW